jgi:hypothetical protein
MSVVVGGSRCKTEKYCNQLTNKYLYIPILSGYSPPPQKKTLQYAPLYITIYKLLIMN